MNFTENCRLFGAYESISGIKDNVVLLHSVVGCHFGTLSTHLVQDMSNINSCCTVINDKDIIFNGEHSLDYAIEQCIKLYDPKMISVITGCVSEITGDDTKSIIKKYENNLPVFCFQGAGFKSMFESGYDDCLLQFIKKFCTPKCNNNISMQHHSINILGMLRDDFKLEADIKQIKRSLNGKISLNCVTACATLDEIKDISKADLNIVFQRGIPAAKFLEDEFNIPYVVMDYPYGLQGELNFLTVMEDFFKIDFTNEKIEAENKVLLCCKKASSYLRSLYGIPVGVYGSKAHAAGLSNFLQQELGMDIAACSNTCTHASADDFINSMKEQEACFLFASSFEGGIADELKIPIFPFEYPVMDRVSLNDTSYIFGEGCINIINDLINMTMILKTEQNKGAFYNEKNMCVR